MTTRIVSPKIYSFRYSFAVDGGTVSTIQAPFILPGGSIACLITINVIAAVTGGAGSTVAFGTGTGAANNAFFAAIAVASLGTGVILVDMPATPSIILGPGEKPSITIGTDPLTAGIFDVTVQYIER
jgi:hypothetical protein